jgi:hypothetical protein
MAPSEIEIARLRDAVTALASGILALHAERAAIDDKAAALYRQARAAVVRCKAAKDIIRNCTDPAHIWGLYAGQLGIIADDGKAADGKLDHHLGGDGNKLDQILGSQN